VRSSAVIIPEHDVRRRHRLERRHGVGDRECIRGRRLQRARHRRRDDPAAVFGKLDRLEVLVCAHGISGRKLGDGPVDICTDEAWDAVLEANLRSVFGYCKQAIPLLRFVAGAVLTVDGGWTAR
jgi:NAD(P)-dependent dehydrogenase (short-subunit alcohol dehydrogenase family)